MSPASGTGRSLIAAGSTTSNTSGSDAVSCRTWSAACRRRSASVATPMPGTAPVLVASWSIVSTPAAASRARCVDRIPATRRTSRCATTWAAQASHRPHAR